LNTKEQEKIRKAEKLEKKILEAEEEYQKKLAEEERIKRKNDIKSKHVSLQKKKVEEEAKRLDDQAEARRLTNETEAKRLVEEVEAKKKANEQFKQRKSQELSKALSIPSMPNLYIVNIPPQEYTPLNAIPSDSTFSSQVLNFEDVVVAIGHYYYDGITKSIEKRSNNRERGEPTKSRSSIGRVLEWKVGPDPEENVAQAASTPHAFVGLNAPSVLEVTNALGTTQHIITKLEAKLKIVKENLTLESKEATRVAVTLHAENLNKALQMQKDKMNVEFERRA
jgi:hypothetical protein